LPRKKDTKDNPSNYQSHTTEEPTPGYELYRYWGEEKEDDDDQVWQEEETNDQFIPYAWTMVELF
jgi:hypothetical protein